MAPMFLSPLKLANKVLSSLYICLIDWFDAADQDLECLSSKGRWISSHASKRSQSSMLANKFILNTPRVQLP